MKRNLLLSAFFLLISLNISAQDKVSPKSDVFLQGFYWNSPPGGSWYDSLARLAPRLASAGFSSIWFPSPAKGAGGGMSMGYDPYDHFDFGEFLQKGSRETRFGSREELIYAIKVFHDAGMEVYADAVLRHMMGGEDRLPYQCRPVHNGNYIVPDSAYMLFNYPAGSGRFKKGAGEFYPNSQNCWVDPLFVNIDPIFRFGEWLDHNKQSVKDSLIVWGKYLKNVIGFDGFRLDAVKAIDPTFMASWLNAANGQGYAVAELWSNTSDIQSWLNVVRNVNGANVAMFDFPLRYTLKDMCNNTSGTFDMNNLDGAGLVNAGTSGFAVSTFVENHDFDRKGWDGTIDNGHDPVLTNKEMAYAYTIFSEGRPSVFFKDYVDYGIGGKIDTLIWIRMKFLGGGTTKRGSLNPWYIKEDGNQDQAVLSRDIYVAKRNGFGNQPGGFLVINDNPNQWIDTWVNSGYPAGTVLKDYSGNDVNKVVQQDGRVKLWAKPRSYAIYVADTTQNINFPPVMQRVPDLIGYTNSVFSFNVTASDANKDSLTFTLTGNPLWLSINNKGILNGTPVYSDTAVSTVILKVTDSKGAFDADTFKISVLLNRAPVLSALSDTTVKATKRFERTASATDIDGDTVHYSFVTAPSFINIGVLSGKISGTPAVTDTGVYNILMLASDGKGGFDTKTFKLTVVKNIDTVIATYGRPKIDGKINVGSGDWLVEWRVVADPDTDSNWNPRDTTNNEVLGIFSTWDADSLYIGVDYVINDLYNSLMLYIEAGIPGGVTNFNSSQGYGGDYPKNFRFRTADAIDFFTAAYNQAAPSLFKISGSTSVDLSEKINSKRGPGGYGSETAIAWNDLYNLGAGLIPNGVKLKFVALVAGGFNWGAGDSAPDNPDVNGNGGPDSLINLAVITPDKNNDGIPDPTVFIISDIKENKSVKPETFRLAQNFPNPFNPSTNIAFEVPFESKVIVKVYNVLGKEIRTLASENMKPGRYNVVFNASELPSGVYFVRMNAGDFNEVKKMVLLK